MLIQKYLDQIWDAFSEGVCITDAEGIVLLVNKRHEELTGISRDTLLGHSVKELIQGDMVDIVLNPEIFSTGETVTRVQNLASGSKLILEGVPVFDEHKNVVLCITFVRDVTLLSDVNKKLSFQNDLLNTFQLLSKQNSSPILKVPEVAFSAYMQRLYSEVVDIAKTDASVLLLGETGVGKDVMARKIHKNSQRADKVFIKVDCGSIPENLIETELFGYVGGSFSGSSKHGKVGLVEAANEGTLFLDEVGELPMQMQTRLLRFLQDSEVMRVGATKTTQVDVRVIAATNKDLEKSVELGQFRSDLYYRLKVAVVHIPALRERKADILPLTQLFLNFYNNKYKKSLTLSEEAKKLLLLHKWHGNVRELDNFVQGIVVTCKKNVVQVEDLPLPANLLKKKIPSEQGNSSIKLEGRTYKEIMKEAENKILIAAMQEFGSISEVARNFQVDRSTIFRKIKTLEKEGLL